MELDSWVIEQAKEELEILEAQYPDRFDCLKLELRAFISQSPSPLPLFDPEPLPHQAQTISTSLDTQESSNRKRRKPFSRERATNPKRQKNIPPLCSKDTADIALQRAEACLRKIREIKQSFL